MAEAIVVVAVVAPVATRLVAAGHPLKAGIPGRAGSNHGDVGVARAPTRPTVHGVAETRHQAVSGTRLPLSVKALCLLGRADALQGCMHVSSSAWAP